MRTPIPAASRSIDRLRCHPRRPTTVIRPTNTQPTQFTHSYHNTYQVAGTSALGVWQSQRYAPNYLPCYMVIHCCHDLTTLSCVMSCRMSRHDQRKSIDANIHMLLGTFGSWSRSITGQRRWRSRRCPCPRTCVCLNDGDTLMLVLVLALV